MQENIAFGTVATLVAVFLFLDPVGYIRGDVAEHFVYMFFHANIFHLAGNALAAWFTFRKPCRIAAAYLVAVLCSFISYSDMPVMGLSSMIYALIGFNTVLMRYPLKAKITLALALSLGLLLPNINGLLHILCFSLSFATAYIYKRIKSLSDDYRHIGRWID